MTKIANISRSNAIRSLAVLGLLIFFLPFLEACSEEKIVRNPGVIPLHSEPMNDFILTGYDLALNFEFSRISIFTVILFFNVIILICVLSNHFNILLISFFNSLLNLISLLIVGPMLPGFGEIKYGAILSVLNSCLLFYLLYRHQEINT